MDDLFKKAAEHYQLPTDSKDWNKVAAALKDKHSAPAPRTKYRRLSWLLLLLPFYFICNRHVADVRGRLHSADNISAGDKVGNVQHSSSGGDKKQPGEATRRLQTGSSSNELQERTEPEDKQEEEGRQKAKDRDNQRDIQKEKGDQKAFEIVVNTKHRQKSQAGLDLDGVATGTASKEVSVPNSGSLYPTKIPVIGNGKASQDQYIHSKFRNNLPVWERKLPGIVAGQFGNAYIVTSNPARKVAAAHPKTWYAGAIVSSGVTSIHFQQASAPRYDYGVLIGRQIGNRFSLEASAFIERKSYNSKGKYLNTSKLYMPPNSEITEVSGGCRMIDFSIAGNYKWFERGAHSWFATTGLSSYFMKREDYAYNYYYPLTGTYYLHKRTYENETKNILAVASLSVGYTHKFGRLTQLRLEPYVQIPLKGLGYVNLPFLSTGIRAGVTRQLF